MFQGLVKAALPTFAATAFMALAATPSPAFTLSAPSLDKLTSASNIERHIGFAAGAGVVRGVGATVIARGVGATVGAVTVTVGAARGATVGVRSFRWNGAII